jgi:hypothetical protein
MVNHAGSPGLVEREHQRVPSTPSAVPIATELSDEGRSSVVNSNDFGRWEVSVARTTGSHRRAAVHLQSECGGNGFAGCSWMARTTPA